MKLSRKIIAFALAAIMVVASFSFVSCGEETIEVPKFSDDTIKIGITGPLTGPAAVYGKAVYNGAKLAIHEINEAGGLDGVMFSFEMFDDTHDPTKVATGYASLVDKGMQLSLGTVTTGPGLEFKELSKNDNLFVLTPSASGDKVPEYANAFEGEEGNFKPTGKCEILYGEQYESVGCSKFNSGMFDAILEKGSTKAVFSGHDHINDWCAIYKGVYLTYNLPQDYNLYHLGNKYNKPEEEWIHGVTVTTLHKDGSFTIEPRYNRIYL